MDVKLHSLSPTQFTIRIRCFKTHTKFVGVHTPMVFTHEFQQIYLPTWCGWAQTIFLPQCCFTSTETIRTITDRKPRTSTWAFTQLLSPDKPIHFRSGISVDGHLSSSCGCVHTHTMHNSVLADIPVYNSQVCLNIMFQAQYNYVICLLLYLFK